MKCVLATEKDLPELYAMFEKIVKNMYKDGLKIWNEYYPSEEFPNDIENKNLYLLVDNNEIVAVFGLYNSTSGQDYFEWKNKKSKATYLARVGVNIKFLRQGIGGLILKNALVIAKQKQSGFLRLLVANINKSAINLYIKNGFTQARGQYVEFSPASNMDIVEFGFEIMLE